MLPFAGVVYNMVVIIRLSKGCMRSIIIAVIIFIFLVGGAFLIRSQEVSSPIESDLSEEGVVAESADLEIVDTEEGIGEPVTLGDQVAVHYEGRLEDGTVFDSSFDRGEPFRFTVGAGSVIEGWEEGLLGMKEGGSRELVIPPEMGYGPRTVGMIPPNSTLIFDIELLEIETE